MHSLIFLLLSALLSIAAFAALCAIPLWAAGVPARRKHRLTVGALMGWTAAVALLLGAALSHQPTLRLASLVGFYALPIMIARLHVRAGWDENIIIGWWLLTLLAGSLLALIPRF